jgi:methylated-DNA-protein-cysteine methyltransferase-like protein
MSLPKVRKERLVTVNPSGKKEDSPVNMIHDVVRQIPRGRVTTYGAIAKLLGLANPRMVGRAMRSVDDKGKAVPAQRVVTASGRLSHDSTGTRRSLLQKEGIKLKGDKIVDFAKLFWDPAVEL